MHGYLGVRNGIKKRSVKGSGLRLQRQGAILVSVDIREVGEHGSLLNTTLGEMVLDIPIQKPLERVLGEALGYIHEQLLLLVRYMRSVCDRVGFEVHDTNWGVGAEVSRGNGIRASAQGIGTDSSKTFVSKQLKKRYSRKHNREITYSTGGALNAGKDSDEDLETDFFGDLGFFLEGIAGGSDFRFAAFDFD